MRISTRQIGDRRVLRVGEARIDAAAATDFREAARLALRDLPPVAILDMAEVEFVDSSGLGAIIGLRKLLAPRTEVELAALSPRVAKVFALTRMDLVFTIHDEVPDTAADEMWAATGIGMADALAGRDDDAA